MAPTAVPSPHGTVPTQPMATPLPGAAADRRARLRHELRTPMQAIIGYSEMLLADARELGERRMAAELATVHEAAGKAAALIVELLDPEGGRLHRGGMARMRRELQTPLSDVAGRALALQHSVTTAREAGFVPDLQKIHSAAARLLTELDDILRVSTLDLGDAAGLELHKTPTPQGHSPTHVLERAAARVSRPNTPVHADHGTVLVADGDDVARELLRHRLQRKGYQVDAVGDARQALDRLKSRGYDLVLLDYGTPDWPGAEVLQGLRQRWTAIELPVIAVTARDATEDILESLELGANDYLSHPIDFPLALARIRTQLSLRRVTRQLEQANARLQRFSYLDGLTGIANRRRFDEYVAEEWRRGSRSGAPLGLILLDIDHFKAYNDTYGHAAGDEVLRRVAQRLSASVHRAEDLVARYGGEEFAVVLPGVTAEGARIVAERICTSVAALGIPHGATGRRVLTVSLGVAAVVPAWNASPAGLIAAADKALYQAKREGRNQVVQADDP